MSSIGSIARSGLAAAQTRLQVAAHNVANSATEGFVRQAVQAGTAASGGVSTRVVDGGDGSALPMAEDLLNAKQASYEFAANLKMVKAEFAMLGSLIDDRI